jgi:transcriptional regulator with XRE-family HTH domain
MCLLSPIRAIDPRESYWYHADIMSRSKEMFKFTPEMGLRLRELRLRQGMTQQELAVLMGRQGKGNHQLIGKVELGKAPYPSLGFVADYLRACRASFNDITDLLNAYTFQPTVLEQRGYKRVRSLAKKLSWRVAGAVEKYDRHVLRAKLTTEPVRKRLARVRAYAQAQEKQRQLNRLVEDAIVSAQVGSVSPQAVYLRVYARKLYRLLSHSKDGHKLKRKLEELKRWAEEVGIGAAPVLTTLRDRITALASERG